MADGAAIPLNCLRPWSMKLLSTSKRRAVDGIAESRRGWDEASAINCGQPSSRDMASWIAIPPIAVLRNSHISLRRGRAMPEPSSASTRIIPRLRAGDDPGAASRVAQQGVRKDARLSMAMSKGRPRAVALAKV